MQGCGMEAARPRGDEKYDWRVVRRQQDARRGGQQQRESRRSVFRRSYLTELRYLADLDTRTRRSTN